jgi:hypothetical protein
MRRLRREAKLNQWIILTYEHHFPWLTEFRDLAAGVLSGRPHSGGIARGGSGPSLAVTGGLRGHPDRRCALDRYLASRKKPWELGRDYERYVGYVREKTGARVSYHGIFKGLEPDPP